jgi:hypothetical protein
MGRWLLVGYAILVDFDVNVAVFVDQRNLDMTERLNKKSIKRVKISSGYKRFCKTVNFSRVLAIGLPSAQRNSMFSLQLQYLGIGEVRLRQALHAEKSTISDHMPSCKADKEQLIVATCLKERHPN